MTMVDPSTRPIPTGPVEPPAAVQSPAPPLHRRVPWVAPLALGVVGALATGYTAVLNPNTSHAFPLCPLKAITGADCPMCGSLRAVHSLTHGDLIGAADHNIVLVALLPLVLAGYLIWLGRSLGFTLPAPRIPPRVVAVGILLLIVFGIVRNLPIPGHDFLNSTATLAGRAS